MAGRLMNRIERLVPVGIRAGIRHAPPRGRGIRLAQAWTRFRPPTAGLYVSHEAGGARLQCDLRDELSRVIYYRGWMDLALETWMRRWLRPGDLYVDVGAHIGYLAALAAEAVTRTGRVVAFEPSPDTYAKLRDAFDPGRFPHVETVNAAVASADGEANFFTADGDWAHQSYRNSLHPAPGLRDRATVPTVSLDGQFANGRLRLLKIDVEGGELGVLAGADRLLTDGHCDALVIELNPEALARAGSSVATLVKHLSDAGFLAHRCSSGGTLVPWRPVEVRTEFADAVFIPARAAAALRSHG